MKMKVKMNAYHYTEEATISLRHRRYLCSIDTTFS